MTDSKPLNIEEGAGISRVTLNRPERLNALGVDLVRALREYFTALERREDIQVVILRAAGKHFCAGLDLKEQAAAGERGVEAMLRQQLDIRAIMLAMRRCPQPIVGIVQGAASGGGFGMALACDVRLATPDARMNSAAVRLGLTGADMGISYFLPRMIGSSAAAEYLLTGRFLEAQRALQLGLVSRVDGLEALHAEAELLAADMLQMPPMALRMAKEGLALASDASLETVMALEDRQQVLCTQTDRFRQAVTTFTSRRGR